VISLPALIGPTGVGKTEVALEVALKLGAEIVSCDSRQVYKYMNIGTAKPTPLQQDKVKHHMIDLVYPDEDFNAWDYAIKAREIIKDIHARGKVPFVVGGSGLYLKALIDGFFLLPKPNRSIREQLKRESPEKLHEKLSKIDREAAKKIHRNDLQRILRALEVYEITKIPISTLQARRAPFDCNPIYIGLKMERNKLYQRIEERVDQMMDAGFLKEVESLLDKGYGPNLNSLQTIGYKELISYIKGEIRLDNAIKLIKRNTKRYAKRQMTWFKGIRNVYWIEIPTDNIVEKILDIIKTNTYNR